MQQIPIASVRVRSSTSEVQARIKFLVTDTSWNHNYVAEVYIQIPAMLAAQSQCRDATVNTENFMRGAVIMSKGIHAVSPRITPVVVSEAFLKKPSGIPAIGPQCFPIDQQRQQAIWENAVVIKPKLLRLDDLLFLSHRIHTHKCHGNIARANNRGRI